MAAAKRKGGKPQSDTASSAPAKAQGAAPSGSPLVALKSLTLRLSEINAAVAVIAACFLLKLFA
jgi:hypothetical protein